jgi:YbbR domain-containing protein
MAKNKENDLLIKVISVLISFGLWIYLTNVENPTKSMRIYNVPVRLESQESIEDQDLILLPNQEIMVTLTVEGPASEVYRTTANDFRVVADLEDVALRKGRNEIPIEIVQYPSTINISPSRSVTVTVNLDDLVEREVDIVSQFNAVAAEGFFALPVTLEPSVGLIRGPASFVNQVTNLAVRGEKSGLTSEYTETLSLVPVGEGNNEVENIGIEPLFADLTVMIYPTKTVEVNPVTTGILNPGLDLKSVIPSPKTIVVAGPANVLAQLERVNTARIDLATITESKNFIAGLVIPDNIHVVGGESNVQIAATVEALGTKTVSKNLSVTGLEEGLEAQLSSNFVNVRLRGVQSQLDTTTAENITATLDLADFGVGVHTVMPDVMLPVGLVHEVVEPESITVTIVQITEP